ERISSLKLVANGGVPPNAGIKVREVLGHVEDARGRVCDASFERTRICFIPSSVLEKDSVSRPHRRFAVFERIPSDANTRGRIEQIPLHATAWNRRSVLVLVYTAANDTVGQKRAQIVQIEREWLPV